MVNPAGMNYGDASDTCIQCHSQGRPSADPIEGKHYDWPVGYDAGQSRLSDYWKLESVDLGNGFAGQRFCAKGDVHARHHLF